VRTRGADAAIFGVPMRYRFEQLALDDHGIVEANGYADIGDDGHDWWVDAIYTEEEEGAVPAVWDYPKIDGAPARAVIVTPRIPGKIVRKEMDKAEQYYADIVHALNSKCDSDIRYELFKDMESGDNPDDTRNHNQQGIGR
jgi:hypothetical protein